MTYIWVCLALTAGPWEGLKIRGNSNPWPLEDLVTVPTKIGGGAGGAIALRMTPSSDGLAQLLNVTTP